MTGRAGGFSFIELVMVIALIGILVGVALPVYQAQILASKERVLQQNLIILRDRIDQYKADKDKFPPSLQALVDEGYLREVPKDPLTGQAEWEEVMAEPDPERPEEEPGVNDVRSLSQDVGSDGRPYSEW